MSVTLYSGGYEWGEYREGNSVLVCTRDKITIANRVTVQLIVTDASVYQGGVINWFNVARSFALVSGNAQVWSTKSVATGGSRCGDMVTFNIGSTNIVLPPPTVATCDLGGDRYCGCTGPD